MNIPTDFEGELERAVRPELLDSYGNVKEAEIIKHLSAGGSVLKAKSQIGRKSKPRVSKVGHEKLLAIAARATAGETITEIDLGDSELKLVPEEIRVFRELRILRLSKNNLKSLPEWIGEFAQLESLAAEDCGLTTLPESLARHDDRRRLCSRQQHDARCACFRTYQRGCCSGQFESACGRRHRSDR